MFFFSLVFVLHTMPTGLLKARYTLSFFVGTISSPFILTTSPGATLVPISGTTSLMLTLPSAISSSAFLREQKPTSLRYLFRRVSLSVDILMVFFRFGKEYYSQPIM